MREHAFFVLLFVMRILQINSARTFGGGERHFVDLCQGLANRGHDVYAAVRPEMEWAERLSFLPSDNVLRNPMRNALDVPSVRQLAKFISKYQIEIVHAHLARDYTLASMAVRLVPEAKLVFTRHVLFPVKSVQKLLLSNVSKVIAVSSAVEANLEKTFAKEKIVAIPNGIEIDKWASIDPPALKARFKSDNNIPADKILIGTIGELKELKGQEDFVLAAQIVAERFPGAHFAVIGKDNSSGQVFRRKLKRLVKVFGLDEHFLWLDWVESTAEALCAVDVFVSPSRSESFGLAIVEALAAGCSIVATETEGAKQILANGKYSELTRVNDPVALAEGICRALEKQDYKKPKVENQKYAAEHFSLERMVAETEAVYRELIGSEG